MTFPQKKQQDFCNFCSREATNLRNVDQNTKIARLVSEVDIDQEPKRQICCVCVIKMNLRKDKALRQHSTTNNVNDNADRNASTSTPRDSSPEPVQDSYSNNNKDAIVLEERWQQFSPALLVVVKKMTFEERERLHIQKVRKQNAELRKLQSSNYKSSRRRAYSVSCAKKSATRSRRNTGVSEVSIKTTKQCDDCNQTLAFNDYKHKFICKNAVAKRAELIRSEKQPKEKPRRLSTFTSISMISEQNLSTKAAKIKATWLKTIWPFKVPVRFQCSLLNCPKKFDSLYLCTLHEQTMHKTSIMQKYSCLKCHESFSLKKYLFIHDDQCHTNDNYLYVCPYCNQTFAYMSKMYVHSQRHQHNSKSCKCNCCKWVLSNRDQTVYVCQKPPVRDMTSQEQSEPGEDLRFGKFHGVRNIYPNPNVSNISTWHLPVRDMTRQEEQPVQAIDRLHGEFHGHRKRRYDDLVQRRSSRPVYHNEFDSSCDMGDWVLQVINSDDWRYRFSTETEPIYITSSSPATVPLSSHCAIVDDEQYPNDELFYGPIGFGQEPPLPKDRDSVSQQTRKRRVLKEPIVPPYLRLDPSYDELFHENSI